LFVAWVIAAFSSSARRARRAGDIHQVPNGKLILHRRVREFVLTGPTFAPADTPAWTD
jgi:hypothetical protein